LREKLSLLNLPGLKTTAIEAENVAEELVRLGVGEGVHVVADPPLQQRTRFQIYD
jgi:hypothetical protein